VPKRYLNAKRPAGGHLVNKNITAVAYTTNPAGISNTLATPAHSAGDTVFCLAFSSSAAIPSLPAGFTNIYVSASAFVNMRLCYKIDTTNSIASVTSLNSIYQIQAVYSGVTGVGTVAPTGEVIDGGPLVIPALGLSVVDGTSWAAVVEISNHIDTITFTGAAALRKSQLTLGPSSYWWDTGAGVAAYAGGTMTWPEGGSVHQAVAFELLA
jgi:hypothetical protein